jgi:hypothetical protein
MQLSRRWTRLLIGIALLLGACGGSKESHAPPAINQDLLIGKWEAEEPEQLIQSFQFGSDNSLKMALWNMQEPIPGTYSWSGPNTISVEYKLSEEAKKASKEALAAFKEHRREHGKKAGGQYGGLISASADRFPDEQVEKENWVVGLSDKDRVVLVLIREDKMHFEFRPPK